MDGLRLALLSHQPGQHIDPRKIELEVNMLKDWKSYSEGFSLSEAVNIEALYQGFSAYSGEDNELVRENYEKDTILLV